MERVKYITNKELLLEIDKSKRKFCYFTDPKYARYDVIVHSVDQITPELIEQTIAKRRTIMTKQGEAIWGNALPDEVMLSDIVFRVMTHEHIPFDPNRKRRLSVPTDVGQAKTPFPPYKHYAYVENALAEVGRSHWKGDFETGSFCIEHGKMNNRLAMMLMELISRYSKRGNWRNYCVDTATEALTQRGWLNNDQITTDDIILSYDGKSLAWSKIKSIFRDDYEGKMFHLTVRGMDALVTPGHKFVTQDGIKPVELLLAKDRVILSGDAVQAPVEQKYSDEFVELIGWVVTEGCIFHEEGRNYPRISVAQNDGQKAKQIRKVLNGLGSSFGETKREESIIVNFTLAKAISLEIVKVIEVFEKVPTMEFMLSLTHSQRELLINTMISGNGYRSAHTGYVQKSSKHMDAFVALCTMAGYRTSVKSHDIVSFGKPTHINRCVIFSSRSKHSNVENIDFHGGKRSGSGLTKLDHQNEPTLDYSGKVWCPETEFGSFMARRNGKAYLTGNSYNDEMCAHALVHICQVGLQFDETKSDNPFAFYTQVIKHCFTRVLNIEAKNQALRDDLLIMAGAQPSFNRLVDWEMQQRFSDEMFAAKASGQPQSTVIELPKKRGRKPKTALGTESDA